MSTSEKFCSTCQRPIPDFAPGGNCPRCLFKAPPDPEEETCQSEKFPRIKNYRLNQLIGEGGFGLVFRATQLHPIHREVAIKVLKQGMEASQVLTRFEAESQALALMDHPHIAGIHDVGKCDDDRPFFAMELVEGIPLGQYCRDHHLDLTARLELFLQACSAVIHAHQRGVIHRDLKPTNILVGETLKLIDFGIAKATENILTEKTLLTGEAQMLGTPEYMSPEQAEGGSLHLDTRTDIYSLGAVLYELVADTPPFRAVDLRARGLSEILRIIREQDPPRPSTHITSSSSKPSPKTTSIHASDVSHDLDWIVMRALEKERDRRYDSVSSFADDIKRFLTHSPVRARPPSATYRLTKFLRRNRLATTAAAIVLLTIIAASITSTTLAFRAIEAREAESHQRQIARAAEQETRRTFAQSDFLTARNYLNQDEPGNAAAHLARALRSDPENEAASKTLLHLLAETNFARPTLPAFELNERAVHLRNHPDGQKILATTARGQARLFDLKNRTILTTIQLPGVTGYTLGTSTPNLSHVALGTTDGRVQIHQLPSGEKTADLQIKDPIHLRAMHLGAQGEALFTATHDGKIQRWSSRDTSDPKWMFQHSSRAVCLDLSADQSTLIAGFGDGHLAVLDAVSGEILAQKKAHQNLIVRIKFLATQDRFATASYDHSARVWKTSDASPVTPPLKHAQLVYNLATSPCGGRIITTSTDQTARVWDTFTGTLHGKPLRHNDHVYHACFSPDGSRVATASRDRTVRIWDPYRGLPVAAPIHHQEAAAPLTFTPDGLHLVTTSRNRDLNHWEISPKEAHPLEFPHENPVNLALFDPDEQKLVTLSTANKARLFDLGTGTQSGPIIPLPGTLILQTSKLNPAFSEGFRTKKTRALLRKNFLPLMAGIEPAKARTFALDENMDRLLIGQSDGSLILWSLREARLIKTIETNFGRSTCLDLQEDVAAIGCSDGTTHLISLPEGRPIHSVRHQKAISSVLLDLSNGRLATGSFDNSARLWSLESGEALCPPLAHSDRASPLGITCRFSPDKSLLATGGSHDTTLRLWSTRDGKPVGRPLKHDDFLSAFAFSPDGKSLATGTPTHDGRADVQVWDLASGQATLRTIHHPDTILWLIFSQDGRKLVSSSQDGTVLVTPLAPGLADSSLPAFSEWFANRHLDSAGNLVTPGFTKEAPATPAAPWTTWLGKPRSSRALAPGFASEAKNPPIKNTFAELRLALIKDPMNRELMDKLAKALRTSNWPRHQLESRFYEKLARQAP